MTWPIRACLRSAALLPAVALGSVLVPVGIGPAVAQSAIGREIAIDMPGATRPHDHMAQLSVGSDFPGTTRTIETIDPALRVAGPSTASAAWVQELLRYVYRERLPIDFVTTHTYVVEGGFLDENGEGDNKLSRNPAAIVQDVRKVRADFDATRHTGLALFFTEWSTSYNPRDTIYDDCLGAAYILSRLRRTEGLAQGTSYWTYSDLFEEPGPQDNCSRAGSGSVRRPG